MDREDIVKLVIWTMTYYGSDAGERQNPGSKLRAQAEHIAEVMREHADAVQAVSRLKHFSIHMTGHDS